MRGLHVLLLLLLLPVFAAAGGHEAPPAPPVPQFWLMVAGPYPDGTDSLYGHSALVMDPGNGSRVVAYTYSIFRPEGSNDALPSAAIGKALMQMQVRNATNLQNEYIAQGRSITLTPLQLTDTQAWSLRTLLQEAAATEGVLPYDMIWDNCSTRLRDRLDDALGGALHDATQQHTGQGVRDWGRPYLLHKGWQVPLWAFLYGSDGDIDLTVWDVMFLPVEFERTVQTVQVPGPNGTPWTLAGPTKELAATTFHAPGEVGTDPYILVWLVNGILLVLVAAVAWSMQRHPFVTRRVVAVAMALGGSVAGLLFLLIAVAWDGTLGPHLAHNQNILLATPLAWLLLPIAVLLWVRPSLGSRLLAWTSVGSMALVALAALLHALPTVPHQNNGAFLATAVLLWGGLLVVASTEGGRVDVASTLGVKRLPVRRWRRRWA